MKSRDGKSQRREEKKKEDHKRESLRRKKIQVCEKVGKSRNTLFFQWFVAPEGRKVGSLKRRVRSQLARWEMNNCTPWWREAHFEVNMLKNHCYLNNIISGGVTYQNNFGYLAISKRFKIGSSLHQNYFSLDIISAGSDPGKVIFSV